MILCKLSFILTRASVLPPLWITSNWWASSIEAVSRSWDSLAAKQTNTQTSASVPLRPQQLASNWLAEGSFTTLRFLAFDTFWYDHMVSSFGPQAQFAPLQFGPQATSGWVRDREAISPRKDFSRDHFTTLWNSQLATSKTIGPHVYCCPCFPFVVFDASYALKGLSPSVLKGVKDDILLHLYHHQKISLSVLDIGLWTY